MNIVHHKAGVLPARRLATFCSVSLLGLGVLLAASPLRAVPPTWQRRAFRLPDSVWSVAAIDANADGRLDIIALGQSQVFALAAPNWRPHVLIDVHEPKMIYCVALDADRDGDMDIAVGRFRVPWINYRQALAQGKKANKPQGPDFSLAWIENSGWLDVPWRLHVMDRELAGIHGLWTGDVNGDEIEDLIAGSVEGPFFPRSMAWFETPHGSGDKDYFQRRMIIRDGAGGRPHYLGFADLNDDGRGEVLLGDSGDGEFTWWEQGTDQVRPWTKHLISQERGATNIRAARIDHNATMDVVASCGHGRGVFWFANPGWKKHPIDPGLADAHAMDCGDFDGDEDIDVAAASFSECLVRWYENDGKGSFTVHTIDTGHNQQAYDLKLTDLDADGRLDILLAGRQSNNVVWYHNRQ